MAIGAGGGGVFFYFHLPLAWMLGAMCFSTIAALAGAPLAYSMRLRSGMVTILGALLGSAFTVEVFQRLASWLGGAVAVAVFVAMITAIVVVYLRYVGRLDPVTSFFSATPGGLAVMTVVGEGYGGDGRVIPLVHACRILVVVFALPLYLQYVEGFEVPRTAGIASSRLPAEPGELVLIVACALFGYFAASRARLPGAQILGPMVVSAIAYLTGVLEGRPPDWLIAAAQVAVGSSIGARFVGLQLAQVWRTVAFAILSACIMVGAAILASKMVAQLIGLSETAMLLAMAPGGLAEMAIIALALDVDTAFVSTMHVLRLILVMTMAPVVFRLLGWGVVRAVGR